MLICEIRKEVCKFTRQRLYFGDACQSLYFGNNCKDFYDKGELIYDHGGCTTHYFILETHEQITNFIGYLSDEERTLNFWSPQHNKINSIYCDMANGHNTTLSQNFIKNISWYCTYFIHEFEKSQWDGIKDLYIDNDYLPIELVKDTKEFQTFILLKCIAKNINYQKEWFDISTEYADKIQIEKELNKLQKELNNKLPEFESLQNEINELKEQIEKCQKKLENN